MLVLPFAAADLTPEQEAWLDSVRYANVSDKWPELSAAQSMELYTKVFILSQATRENNFPYFETGEGSLDPPSNYYNVLKCSADMVQ